MTPPNGLEEIILQFGNIQEYILGDGEISINWEREKLDYALIPFSLPLSWNKTISIKRFRCHKLMIAKFEKVFDQLQVEGLSSKVTSFGGCYQYRAQRTGTKLSTHAWGIAIDLNSETNPQGNFGNMDQSIIDVFKENGFEWGGDWLGKVKDPMHFQFCTRY